MGAVSQAYSGPPNTVVTPGIVLKYEGNQYRPPSRAVQYLQALRKQKPPERAAFALCTYPTLNLQAV